MTNSPRRSILFQAVLGALVLPALMSACATMNAPSKPIGAEQIRGVRYKLVSGMDRRVIEFNIKGGALVGTLVETGRVLSQVVGVQEGREFFSLSPDKGAPPENGVLNTFQGVYKNINADGSPSERECTVQFYEDKFTWNLESASWERAN
jgi:hypothetical protein